MHDKNRMLTEGRELLALLGHEHADDYNELDILEQCAVEGFVWQDHAWVPEDAETLLAEDTPEQLARRRQWARDSVGW